MGSESDRKKDESPYARRKGRVVEDERGRRIWEGTIQHVKLTLMKTGIVRMPKEERQLTKLRETDPDIACEQSADDLELVESNKGFDPYDSTKK